MIIRLVLCAALLSGAGEALAQESDCILYKVKSRLLNISRDFGGEVYIDMLERDNVACVVRVQKVGVREQGYVAFKLELPNKRTAVNGWATLRFLEQLTSVEAAAYPVEKSPAAPTTPIVSPAPPSPARPSISTAPPEVIPTQPPAPVSPSPTAQAAGAQEDELRFDQPVPFGPFPVNGQSIKDLIVGVPLFAPIEGLDEGLWKKTCSNCHAWDQARLCEQGSSYAKTPRTVLRQPHPYGGALKIALMRWAKSGCK